ncbi:hypothetical protein MMC14_001876 [Varicellaria rhodocarpa]|nr:hypothetical protein [Varicellaria rhodocarpa]
MIWTFSLPQYRHLPVHHGDLPGYLSYWAAGWKHPPALFHTCRRIAAETIPLVFSELPLLHFGAIVQFPWSPKASFTDGLMVKFCRTYDKKNISKLCLKSARSVMPKKTAWRLLDGLNLPISSIYAFYVTKLTITNDLYIRMLPLTQNYLIGLVSLFPNLQFMIFHCFGLVGHEKCTFQLRVLDYRDSHLIEHLPPPFAVQLKEMAYTHFIQLPTMSYPPPVTPAVLLENWAQLSDLLMEYSKKHPSGIEQVRKSAKAKARSPRGVGLPLAADKVFNLELFDARFPWIAVEAEDFHYHACIRPLCTARAVEDCRCYSP